MIIPSASTVNIELTPQVNPLAARSHWFSNPISTTPDRNFDLRSLPSSNTKDENKFDPFLGFLIIQIAIIICFYFFVEYEDNSAAQTIQYYGIFQDVHVMIYIGFAFLMTFIKKYGYSSAGFNFLIAALVVQINILFLGLWHRIFSGHGFTKILIDLPTLINAEFGAGSVLISFGAVLGKLSPAQYIVLAIIQSFTYCINEAIMIVSLNIHDIGGSIVIHIYGAFFGLALSWVITPSDIDERSSLNAATPTSDLFSMAGTIFLWMYWPSFNGALAQVGPFQNRALINTYLALATCCFTVFVFSRWLEGKKTFDMCQIQNATLAGGVAVGSAADLMLHPYGAMICGFVAGIVSSFGFATVQPFLLKYIKLHDSCGVHNLHGMPGIIGGLVSVVTAYVATSEIYGADLTSIVLLNGRSALDQAITQLIGIAITLGISIGSGIVCGLFLISPLFTQPSRLFDDREFWHYPSTHLEVDMNDYKNDSHKH